MTIINFKKRTYRLLISLMLLTYYIEINYFKIDLLKVEIHSKKLYFKKNRYCIIKYSGSHMNKASTHKMIYLFC